MARALRLARFPSRPRVATKIITMAPIMPSMYNKLFRSNSPEKSGAATLLNVSLPFVEFFICITVIIRFFVVYEGVCRGVRVRVCAYVLYLRWSGSSKRSSN